MMARWQVTGADAKTGRSIVETFEARTGREAQDAARAHGILTSSVVPLHEDAGPPSGGNAKSPSALSKADWRKLEWTIIKGVAGGVFLIWALHTITQLLGEMARQGMRSP